ncbi:MAG: FAD-dependent oxidoreductase [Acidobacteriota bacterium]|nr:MAG: FAD-dependent oxidoreductase [Acidobacteriota bacterium]
MNEKFDIAVIGAGVFGSWTAHELVGRGKRVALIDAYGPGNSRSSSGGETRIIRMGYGADEIYTRWSNRALGMWRDLSARCGIELFIRTGVLWMARENDPYATATLRTLETVGINFEQLGRDQLEERFPRIRFGDVSRAIYEPESGVLLARRAVQAVVQELTSRGGIYLSKAVPTPVDALSDLMMMDGSTVRAEKYVFACGPWLPKILPDLLGERIHPTRQEVFFFGTPPGDDSFTSSRLPAWIDFGAEIYGLPDIEHRGFKLALDRHGPAVDPDSAERRVGEATLAEVRGFLADRFPDLQDAPVVESRVCQYENTSDGNFLIDRHPRHENIWILGGGSGHGFKHGPAIGEYAASLILEDGDPEPRFSLESKETFRSRAVF